MFKKLTDNLSRIVGVGVIAAAGVTGILQESDTSFDEKGIEHTLPDDQSKKNMLKNIESSVNATFSKQLKERGYSSVSIQVDTKEVSITFESIDTSVRPVTIHDTDLYNTVKEGGNKYLIEEKVSKVITKELNYYTNPTKQTLEYKQPPSSTYKYTDPSKSTPHYTDPTKTTPHYTDPTKTTPSN